MDFGIYRMLATSTPFILPRKIVFGVGALKNLAEELKFCGVAPPSKIVVVISATAKKRSPTAEYIAALEKEYSVSYYTDVEYEPTVECLERLSEYLRKEKEVKAVIVIGGGSSLDLTKVAVAAKDNPDKPVEKLLGKENIPKRVTPFIAVPSTSGSGSEATRYAVLTKDHFKTGAVSNFLVPDVAVVDPTITVTVSPKLTAGTGLDALSHAVEGMICVGANPLTDTLALESAKLIFKYLRRAYYRGDDVEARYFMAMASTAAGITICNAGDGIALGHFISHTIGPLYGIHHGVACGISLPYVMKFYLPVMREKFAALSRAIGLCPADFDDMAAERCIEAVWNLLWDLEVSPSLKDLGVSKSDLEMIAEKVAKGAFPSSPIPCTKERVLKTLESMYEGELEL
jgi:alcohol dehydrogenase